MCILNEKTLCGARKLIRCKDCCGRARSVFTEIAKILNSDSRLGNAKRKFESNASLVVLYI